MGSYKASRLCGAHLHGATSVLLFFLSDIKPAVPNAFIILVDFIFSSYPLMSKDILHT